MNKFLTLQFFFETRPSADFRYTKLTLAAIALFFLFGIAFKIYRKKYAKNDIVRKIIKRYPGRLFASGTILLFLLFARESGIPVLSMRIWWAALAVWIIFWTISVCLKYPKEYRRRSAQWHSRAVNLKYLPKKKK